MDSHKSYSFFQQQISQLSERNKNIRNHQNQYLKQFTDVIKIIIPQKEQPEKTAEINLINIFDDFNNSTQYKQKFSKELEEILQLSQSYQYVTKEKLQKLSAKSKSKLIKYLINTVFDQSKNLIFYDTSQSQLQLQNNPITTNQYINYKENLDLLKKFSKVTTMCTKFSRILDPLEILKKLDSEEQKKQEQQDQNLTNMQNFQSSQNNNLMTFNSQENFLHFDQNASPKEYIFQKGQIPSQFLSPQSSKSLEKSTFITDKNDNFSSISDQQISKNDTNFKYKSLEKSRQKSSFKPYLYPKYLDTVGPSLQPQLKQNMDLEQFDDFRREYIKDRIHEDVQHKFKKQINNLESNLSGKIVQNQVETNDLITQINNLQAKFLIIQKEQGIEQLVKEYEKEINLQQGTIQTLRNQISSLCTSKQYDQNEYEDNQKVKYYTEKINKFKQIISNLNNLMGEKDQEMQQLKRKEKQKLVNKAIENNYVKKLQIAQKEKNFFQQRNDDLMQNTEALNNIIEDLKKQNLQLNKKIDLLYKHGRKLSCDGDNDKENKNNQNLLQLKIKNQNAKLEKIVENEIFDLLQKFLKQQGLTNFNNFGTNNPEVKKTNEFMRQFILQQINI
ncbi:hypothetical protein PPERSA_06332 [Pseudocohnilembus persalinus]|uniref:Uncharacterized protein n=1 Tax=Pseudocohnilembus persalinus TaxID=266149 RepID=A0A0V0QIT9_PSEPJ|nr:hypothetical protein PPERSA_06332 [Pseudocohnilembus persalinus]|eukprot:KRX02137.1 hypothetical protein PPERSA_06332 [Pseudocohnilembus persalinus]